MDWYEFLAVWREIVECGSEPSLIPDGVPHDNATRDQLKESGKAISANYDEIFGSGNIGIGGNRGDFVYFSPKTIKVAAFGFGGGGHPVLAGMRLPTCAGIIEDDGFFFHSGHFHPDLESAIYFMCQFINNSAKDLDEEDQKQKMLDDVCTLNLKLYTKGSTTDTYDITFPEMVKLYRESQKGSPVLSPRRIGSSSAQRPIPTMGVRETGVRKSPSMRERKRSSMELFGRTEPALHMEQSPVRGRARWIPDSDVQSCSLCSSKFTIIRRKHHCRKCGRIICNDCSKNRKIVKLPAAEHEKDYVDVSESPVRICNSCNINL